MANRSDPTFTIGGKMIRKAALPTKEEMMTHQSPKTKQRPSHLLKSESDNVRVMVRVRPFSQTEVESAKDEGTYMQSVIDMPRSDQVVFLDHLNDYQVKQGFNFDKCFWSCTQQQSEAGFSDQKDVYESTGKLALETAWDGINSCIFAYGQTGSGKTHTMMGDPSQIASEEGCNEELLGVIPRLCRDLFEELEDKKEQCFNAGMRKRVEVEVKFIEIYNEKVRDLLVHARAGCDSFKEQGVKSGGHIDPEDLRVREHPVTGPYVHGVTVHKPTSYQQIIDLINQGNQERSVASTKLNDRSSRSHAMFRITLTQTTVMSQERVGIGGPKTITSERRSNMNLVDLAGSENVKRSGAAGATLVEAQKINLSLTTLRRVIDALIENKPTNVVPYRDSTLTWLLRQDLGGNAKTFMLATVSPHYINAYESLRTLEYAMRARSIVNVVSVNEDDTAKLISDLEKKIAETQKEMQSGKASKEELEVMQADLVEAKAAKEQLQDKFERVALEAESFKQELQQVRERQVAQAFKQAVVLNLTRARLRAAQQDLNQTKNEWQSYHVQTKEAKEKDRQLLDAMLREKEELERKSEAMKQEELSLRNQLQQEKEALEKEKKELQGDLDKRGSQFSQQTVVLNERIGELTEKMSALLKEHEEEKKRVRTHHERELAAILSESEEMMKQHQKELEALHVEMQNHEEMSRRDLRSAAYDAEYQQRLLHGDIENYQKQLAEEKAAHYRTKQLVEEEKAKTVNEKIQHEATKKAYDEKLKDMEADLQDVIEHARECENEVKERLQEKQKMQKFFTGLERQIQEIEATHHQVTKLLQHLNAADSGLPDDWTLEDVRAMVSVFKTQQKEYSSIKPNKEQLKQMLRADPERRGARRMRELLDGCEAEGPPVQVIMDGMRCPELPPHRSMSPNAHYDPELHAPTEADKIPYASDSPVRKEPLNNFGRYTTYPHPVHVGRRSRTPTGKIPSTSPVRSLNFAKTHTPSRSPVMPRGIVSPMTSPRKISISGSPRQPKRGKKTVTLKA